MLHPSQGARHGVALVIVLSMLVLITVLVVSFTSNMRLERQVSHTVSEDERTKLVAEAALAHAVSILSTNIPQPAPPVQPVIPQPSPSILPFNGAYPQPIPVNWTVNPGLLNLITGPAGVTAVPLSSNPSASYVSNPADANLNQLQVTTNQYPIASTGEPMYVAWVPLLQNPASTASATNPIVSRYAFWIDDENAKINVNTAYKKPSGMTWTDRTPGNIKEDASSPTNTTDYFPLGHPGSVNLDVFGPGYPTALLNALKTRGAARTPEIFKSAVTSGDAETLYQNNKFFLTATSRDPEFNVFGKSRLYMYAGPTGQLDTALGGGMFQRFRDLFAPMYFHGNENSSTAAKDQTAMYYTAANLSSIFARNDWPGMPAVSFVDKWDKDANGGAYTEAVAGDVGRREADQVAWNIITMGSLCDYSYTSATPGVFAKLGNKIVTPADSTGTAPIKTGSSGSINYPNAAVCLGSLSKKAILPAAPRPMVDEICLNVLPEKNEKGTGYYLKFAMSYGVWLPPNYPAVDFGAILNDADSTSCDFLVGLTHLEYSVTGVDKPAAQKDNKYFYYKASKPEYLEGIKTGKALLTSGTMSPGQRMPLYSILSKSPSEKSVLWYARTGDNGFADDQSGSVLFPLDSVVNVDVRVRVYVRNQIPYTSLASQLVPVWDTHDWGTSKPPSNQDGTPKFNPADPPPARQPSAFAPPADDQVDYIKFSFSLDLKQVGATQVTRSLRVADPRTGGLARSWVPSWDSSSNTQTDTDSLLLAHNPETDSAVTAGKLDKLAYIDMTAPAGNKPAALLHPSIGMFSLVPTGMQRGIPGSTFKLQPNPNPATQLPDWLLLDLFAPTVSPPNVPPVDTSTAWSDSVKMNATAGKLNINAAIYPDTGGSFSAPTRLLPLKALFTNTPPDVNRTAEVVARNIVNHTLASGGSKYAGGQKFYNYPGEICEVSGVADTGSSDWEREATIRNLASIITTKSNTFSVWGVAQTLKKSSANHQYGQYEKGDLVTGEKRFQAIVERFVWPGADGVAGNGHVSSGGTYDRLTQGATQPGATPPPSNATAYSWEKLDGPDAPTYPIATSADANNVTTDANFDPYNKSAPASYTGTSSDALETANNPVRATMKYRVIYFKYLD